MLQIKFKASAQKRFLKFPIEVQKRIVAKLEFYLNQANPLVFAEVLTNSKIGKYRFRVGSYRIIFDLEADNIIMILDVDHRKDIYR